MHGQLAADLDSQHSAVTPAPPVVLTAPVNSAATAAAAAAATQQQPALMGNGTPLSARAIGLPVSQQASASNQQHLSSPPRMSSPDMDVDVGGTPEPEGMGADDMAQDGKSDLVMQQLERGLPRSEGLGDFGWMKEKEGSEDRWLELVLAVKGHKDAVCVAPSLSFFRWRKPWHHFSGNRYAIALEAMSEETNIPFLSFNICLGLHHPHILVSCLTNLFQFPLSLKLVEVDEPFWGNSPPAHIRYRVVRVPRLTRLTKPLTRKLPSYLRRGVGGMNLEAMRTDTFYYFKYVSLILSHYDHVYDPSQRLYQALTSPSPPSGPPYVSTTNFASLRAGPGTARPLHSSDSERLPAAACSGTTGGTMGNSARRCDRQIVRQAAARTGAKRGMTGSSARRRDG